MTAPLPTRTDRAVRDAWDAVAPAYAALLPDLSVEAPLDRAVLAAFVETVGEAGGGLVAEVGCGSGRVTAHLADAGLRVVGLDLAPAMARAARTARPDLLVAAADTLALPLRTGALGGLVSWYSVVTTPPAQLPAVVAECARVLRPGAPVVVAFQSGNGERVDRSTSYGLPVSLTYYRHSLDLVVQALEAADLVLRATVRREPSLAHETTPQALLLAERR